MPDPQPSPQDLLARLQQLVDTGRAEDGHPLEWSVPAYYLGDMSAVASLSLRSGA